MKNNSRPMTLAVRCALVALFVCAVPYESQAQTKDRKEYQFKEPDAEGRIRHESEDGFVWLVRRQKGYYEVFDASGKVIIPLSRRYTAVRYNHQRHYFHVGRRIDANTTYRGCCAADGTELISPDRGYTFCSYVDFKKTYTVKKGEFVGFCDSLAREVLSPDLGYTSYKYDKEHDGYHVGRYDVAGYCDSQFHEIVPISRGYTYCRRQGDHFLIKRDEHMCGGCDKDGKEIVPPVWYNVVWNNSVNAFMGKRDLNSRWEKIDLNNPYPEQ